MRRPDGRLLELLLNWLLTIEQNENNIPSMFVLEGDMIRTIVEEAVALLSIALFVGMIAVWADVLSSGW
jgi:hypothetical protein